MKNITYMTTNKFKAKVAKHYLEPLGFEIEVESIDCPEIQADSIEEVAKFSSKYASDYLKKDTLKNDSGLIISALNGFPGAYTKYVEETLGVDGILKLMENKENREAYFLEVLAYTEYGKETVTFTSKTKGTLAKVKTGTNGWSWDFIFIPDGYDKTMACFSDDARANLWDEKAYVELAKYLTTKDSGLGVSKEQVRLEDYNPKWKEEYQKEKEKLLNLIGNYIIEIEHVGSTAIENLKAKPIIDIAILIEHLDDALKFSKILENNGYSFRYDGGVKGEYLASKEILGKTTHFIHIVERGSKRWHDWIVFKNYLNNHKETVIAYQKLKEELSEKYKDERKLYTSSKNDFIKSVIEKADQEI